MTTESPPWSAPGSRAGRSCSPQEMMFLEVEILVPVTQPGHGLDTGLGLDTPTVRQLRLAPAQYHEGFWESGAEFLSAHYTQYPVM